LNSAKLKKLFKQVVKMKEFYFILLIPLTIIIIFDYLPLYGVTIAFKNFKFNRGITGSEWNDFAHFKRLFSDVFFMRILINTLRISFLRMTVVFVCPIIFALLLNELVNLKLKKVIQTISYLPHFMSWVVIAGFVYQILSPEYGIFNLLIKKLGGDPVFFMGNPRYFVPVLIITLIWAGVGWGSIIYLAAISNIDTSMYESAELDGANRLHQVLYITIPSIAPMITIMFILGLGGVLKAGFDPIFNLYNDLVMERADVIDTYVFRVGLYEAKYDYSTAVGLFQNAVGLIFLLSTNAVVKKINNQGIF